MPSRPDYERLDHRIQILRQTTMTDVYNEPVPTWSSIVELWASRFTASGSEGMRASEVAAVVQTSFVVRWSPDVAGVTPKDRLYLVSEAVTYDILAMLETERNRWVELRCVARADK